MSSLPPRQRVRASFNRAARSYDAAALVQRQVCEHLLTLLTLLAPPVAAPRILDAGCGTGYGARLLRARWPQAHITAADFAPAMLALARHDADQCCVADIEALPLPDACFDVCWSSLTLQWCDAGKVFAEAARVLRPGGQLAVSTLGSGTFGELRQAFSHIDRYRHTLAFDEPSLLVQALTDAGFGQIATRRVTLTLHYPDLSSLLHAVKAIGANALGDGARRGMMGRKSWQALQAAYESQRQPAGLPASYDVLFLTARR